MPTPALLSAEELASPDGFRSHFVEDLRGALHPQEERLQRTRPHQATPAFREDIKARQVVEHRQARMVQLGSRQARYVGQSKTKFQALLIAMLANLTLMAKAILIILRLPGRITSTSATSVASD